MSAASVALDRSGLLVPLAPLTIAHDGTVFRLGERGIGRPDVRWRFEKMPNNPHIHGEERTAASKEESSIPLEVLVAGATWDAVEASMDELDVALSQWAYVVTVTVAGRVRTWNAGPADWNVADSGRYDAYRVDACFEVLNISIPVYPIPGS